MNVEDLHEGKILLFDKEKNWTSFDVVNKLRAAFRIKKVGHAGTLDPLATGLLIICTSKKTKEIQNFVGLDKTYTGTIRLGATTPSYDLETSVDNEFDISEITEEKIYSVALSFIGWQNQKAPAYSAKKIEGKKFYDIARKGNKPPVRRKWINIKSFDITSISMPEVHFSITCSSGTYIRTIAHEFGLYLNSGALLSSLRRTAIGDFNVSDATEINSFIESIKKINK